MNTSTLALATGVKLGLVSIDATLLFQLINTLVLYLLLKKVLFKPVTEFMQKREDGIAKQFKDAETKDSMAQALIKEYEEKIKNSEEEGRQIIKDSVVKAEARSAEILKDTEKEIVVLKDRAEKDIEREKEKAINALKDEIATLALMTASKVIEKELNDDSHGALINQFIDEVGDTKWQS